MKKMFIELCALSFFIASCSSVTPEDPPKLAWSMPPSGVERTVAQAAGAGCPQQETAFMGVLNDFRSCKDAVYPDQAKCGSFCEKADLLLGSGYGAPSCPPAVCAASELENARRRGQQEVLKDLSVRASAQSTVVYGTSDEDCRNRVRLLTQNLESEVIGRCNSQALVIRNCAVVAAPKISVAQGKVPSISGTNRFEIKANSSTPEACVERALIAARENALNKCRQLTGHECTLSAGAPITKFKFDKPLIGATKLKCDAEVFAEASADVVFQCSGVIEAINQARAF